MAIAPTHSYVVVDTNVIIYLITGSAQADRFAPYLTGQTVLVSFQTVAELKLIALRRGWGQQKLDQLDQVLRAMVVVPATEQITDRWARLMASQTTAGSRVDIADAWIAATALTFDCPVVTNDRGDFERISGLVLLPPAAS